jgi:hypothetical protein
VKLLKMFGTMERCRRAFLEDADLAAPLAKVSTVNRTITYPTGIEVKYEALPERVRATELNGVWFDEAVELETKAMLMGRIRP